MLEAFLLGVGTVLLLERDAWTMITTLKQAPPPHPRSTPRNAVVFYYLAVVRGLS